MGLGVGVLSTTFVGDGTGVRVGVTAGAHAEKRNAITRKRDGFFIASLQLSRGGPSWLARFLPSPEGPPLQIY
jgi:hypothetical protein